MRAIDDDAQAVERQLLGESALGEFDVARLRIVDAFGAADAIGRREAGFKTAIHQAFDLHLGLVGELEAVGAEKLDAVVFEMIMRGGDHHAQIGAQRARQHGDGGRRQRAELEHVHADRGEARDEGGFDHVAGEARILADHHAVLVFAAGEDAPGRHAGLHRDLGRHRERIGEPANAVRAEKLAGHERVLVLAGGTIAENRC